MQVTLQGNQQNLPLSLFFCLFLYVYLVFLQICMKWLYSGRSGANYDHKPETSHGLGFPLASFVMSASQVTQEGPQGPAGSTRQSNILSQQYAMQI